MAGMILAKAIKPAKLKVKEMRLALLNPLHKMQKELLRDYQETTASWEHKVEFESAVSLALGGATVSVITNDDIYRYVDEGTKPHEIWAGIYTGLSDKTTLAFPSGFLPKTQPGVIGSGPGASSGPTVFTPYVQHPGTEAREFSLTIKRKWEPLFYEMMAEAMAKAAEASGHKI